MRIQAIPEFDPEKEYKIGERVMYKGETLIAVRWTETPMWLIEKYADTYFGMGIIPTQCGLCKIKKGDCKGLIGDSPCFRWSRSDKKKIHFKVLRYAKRDKKI